MQINPDAMNSHLEQDGERKENTRYRKREEVEQPAFDIEEEYEYNPDEEIAFDPSAVDDNSNKRVQINNPRHEEDEEVLPGLFNSDIISYKKQFGEVFFAEIKGQAFLFRPLERYEYKEIIATPNTDPLMREEMICEYCVLYPESYDFSQMANQKAGYPAVLSELIMDHSGFTREVQVRKL